MYNPISKLFHWTMGVLILGLLAVGRTLDEFVPPFKFTLIGWHKSLGMIVLALTVLRVLWWLGQTKPALVKSLPAWMAPWVSFGHNLLYGFMVLMPLSGWLMSNAAGYPVSVFGWVTLPELVAKNQELREVFGEVHEIAAWGLIALLVLHVGAAVVHHRIFKDDTLTRMLPGR